MNSQPNAGPYVDNTDAILPASGLATGSQSNPGPLVVGAGADDSSSSQYDLTGFDFTVENFDPRQKG
jgi:hypothetical protein